MSDSVVPVAAPPPRGNVYLPPTFVLSGVWISPLASSRLAPNNEGPTRREPGGASVQRRGAAADAVAYGAAGLKVDRAQPERSWP